MAIFNSYVKLPEGTGNSMGFPLCPTYGMTPTDHDHNAADFRAAATAIEVHHQRPTRQHGIRVESVPGKNPRGGAEFPQLDAEPKNWLFNIAMENPQNKWRF